MSRRASIRSFLQYTERYCSWKSYLRCPGDGRIYPQIGASTLLRALVACRLLRESSFAAIEALVRSPARQGMRLGRSFGDDTLAYFTERLDPERLRLATSGILRQVKRNKAFDDSRWIGLVVDGTGAGASRARRCDWCRPVVNPDQQILGFGHKLAMIAVAGTELPLPFDIEPYGPGDSEYWAGYRLLRRAVHNLGPRFANYVVVDGAFATAPFLHGATKLGLKVIARLKGNLPELLSAAEKRFASLPPNLVFKHHGDSVEIWDKDDFDPWNSLQWQTVRVVFYRQHKRDGTVVQAYWLTNFSRNEASSRAVFFMAKSRWEIENQGFNDAKNRYGFEHVCHHERNSLLINWLIIALTLTLERLYRLRYLHRGSHSRLQPISLLRLLRLSLTVSYDTS